MIRHLILLLILTVASCSSSAPVSKEQDTSELPGVATLDRLASATGSAGLRDTVATSSGAEEFIDLPTQGYELVCDQPGQLEWVILRIGHVQPLDTGVTYTRANADTEFEFTGSVWMACADFATGRWRFFECQDDSLSMPLDSVANPVSPSGYVYVAGIVFDVGSEAIVDGIASVSWEYSAPIFPAPVLTDATRWQQAGWCKVTGDAGASFDSLQFGRVELYRCEGTEFVLEQAVRVGSWDHAAEHEFVDESWGGAPKDSCCYCAYIAASNQPALDNGGEPASPWSNVLIIEAEE